MIWAQVQHTQNSRLIDAIFLEFNTTVVLWEVFTNLPTYATVHQLSTFIAYFLFCLHFLSSISSSLFGTIQMIFTIFAHFCGNFRHFVPIVNSFYYIWVLLFTFCTSWHFRSTVHQLAFSAVLFLLFSVFHLCAPYCGTFIHFNLFFTPFLLLSFGVNFLHFGHTFIYCSQLLQIVTTLYGG